MTEPNIITSVTAVVPTDRVDELLAGYRELIASADRPDGLMRSALLRGQDGRWSIQTTWRDRAAIIAAREAGRPPAALVLFDRVVSEHSHEILTVEASSDW